MAIFRRPVFRANWGARFWSDSLPLLGDEFKSTSSLLLKRNIFHSPLRVDAGLAQLKEQMKPLAGLLLIPLLSLLPRLYEQLFLLNMFLLVKLSVIGNRSIYSGDRVCIPCWFVIRMSFRSTPSLWAWRQNRDKYEDREWQKKTAA